MWFFIDSFREYRDEIQTPTGARNVFIYKMLRVTLGPTQPTIQWVLYGVKQSLLSI